eukprot:UN13748
MLNEGHEVGNHMMYDQPSIQLDEQKFRRHIFAVQSKIDSIYSRSKSHPRLNKWFRPGSGMFNSQMLSTLKELGYRLVLGNVYPSDPQLPYVKLVKAHVISRARPGAIIILHDLKHTPQALRDILHELSDNQGYEFVTLSELVDYENA